MQTVDIQLPNSSLIFQAIEERPIPPEWVKNELVPGSSIRIKGTDGATYTFNSEGDVFVKRANGQHETYWAKPTLSWAVKHKDTACSSSVPPFFQFHSDGSVTGRIFGLTYLWQPDKAERTPVECAWALGGRYIDDGELKGWYFTDDDEYYEDGYDDYETSYDSDYSNYGDYRRGKRGSRRERDDDDCSCYRCREPDAMRERD
jgi:hypothetical protein